MDIQEIMDLSKEECHELFGQLLHSEAFSAYASGDHSKTVARGLRKTLALTEIPEEIWDSDEGLAELVSVLTWKVVTRAW